MKKALTAIVVIFIGLGLIVLFFLNNHFNFQKRNKENPFPSPVSNLKQKDKVKEKKSIFVPYWINFAQPLDITDYDRVIYFGLDVTEYGVNKTDAGYNNIEKFAAQVDGQEKYLTIKMLNNETNSIILKNPSSWQKIIDDAVNIAVNYRFNGLVLDLEMGSLLFDDLVKRSNQFVQYFFNHAKGQNLRFALTVYGDNFYRRRFYDLAKLSRNSDEIMIMAYDFHKSSGEPGPNFPLGGREKYDYDFRLMIEDFSRAVPYEKLTVIFGMYGYDWAVDEKKRPIRPAKALSLAEIKKQFIESCQWQDCVIKRDPLSRETEVNYIISEMNGNFANLYYHIVWFEDEQSVEAKTQYLLEKGIGGIGYWAYGYF